MFLLLLPIRPLIDPSIHPSHFHAFMQRPPASQPGSPIHPCSNHSFALFLNTSPAQSDFLTAESHSNILVTESQPRPRQSLSSILKEKKKHTILSTSSSVHWLADVINLETSNAEKQRRRRKQRAPHRASLMDIKHFRSLQPVF
jgi:hypothetical protein